MKYANGMRMDVHVIEWLSISHFDQARQWHQLCKSVWRVGQGFGALGKPFSGKAASHPMTEGRDGPRAKRPPHSTSDTLHDVQHLNSQGHPKRSTLSANVCNLLIAIDWNIGYCIRCTQIRCTNTGPPIYCMSMVPSQCSRCKETIWHCKVNLKAPNRCRTACLVSPISLDQRCRRDAPTQTWDQY